MFLGLAEESHPVVGLCELRGDLGGGVDGPVVDDDQFGSPLRLQDPACAGLEGRFLVVGGHHDRQAAEWGRNSRRRFFHARVLLIPYEMSSDGHEVTSSPMSRTGAELVIRPVEIWSTPVAE